MRIVRSALPGTQAINLSRMLRLALLEMAGSVLRGCAAERLVRRHYLKRFDTVEINASFYSWPTVGGVQSWRRQPGRKKFVYTVKVCELITQHQEVQRHHDTRERFWHDRRHSGRPDGLFSVPLTAEAIAYTKTSGSTTLSASLIRRAATSSNSDQPAGQE